jgi:hypothetical protein
MVRKKEGIGYVKVLQTRACKCNDIGSESRVCFAGSFVDKGIMLKL